MDETNSEDLVTNEIQSLSAQLGNLRRLNTPSLPNFTVLERTLTRVIDRYDIPPVSQMRNAVAYLEKFLEKVKTQNWNKTPLSFVTQVAGFAFSKEFHGESKFQPVRDFLLQEVRVSSRDAFLNAMVRVYLDSYEKGAEHTIRLAGVLHERRAQIGPKWGRIMAAVPVFFQPSNVIAKLSELMVKMDDPWHNLRTLGLRQPHAPGLMDYVHLEFVEQAKVNLTDLPTIMRMLSWLKPDGQALRRVGAGAAISALLWPWRERQPSAEISSLLIDKLTEFYGHPKASRDPAWNEVPPELERVFMRWLMKADFKFLFRILNEAERGHMWPDREDFWMTMLERGKVDDLWVAFNDTGYSLALKKMSANSRERDRFGLQVGEQNKSIVLMRIGRFVVVEGTFNFPVLIFDGSSPRSPRLFQRKYDVATIRNLNHVDRIPHNSNWQSKVSLALGKA